MELKRYYTTENVPVYSMFEWKYVDVVIKHDKTQEILFEGSGLEFPVSYSQNACDIIAKMYFRKNGVPKTGHETSMKEVVARMVNFWILSLENAGLISGDQVDILHDELTYTMLNQMWAPNSPQWFNTGLAHAYGITGESGGHYYYDTKKKKVVEAKDSYTRTQGSACFILNVNDSLMGDQSIMDTLLTETRLFKYGSGVGSNYSKLRGAGEKLASGGKSSGVMSFLKVSNQNAGAIKSGGFARRAAKMCILDVDHPEILEFIRWKSREEDKVVALGKMGYDTSMNGEAYETVSGQNVNNSISVPDAFMNLIGDQDHQWELKGRVDSSTNQFVDPNLIWQEIAWAAWRSGDPGLFFEDNINNWNTCPSGGRIKSCNPCFTGNMRLLTANGYVPIGELDGQDVNLVNKDGNVSKGKVWCSGKRYTVILRLSDNSLIHCTPDHIFMTIDGTEVEAQHLHGKTLMPYLVQNHNWKFDTEYVKYGFIQGDGSLSRLSEKYKFHQGLEISIGEKDKDILKLFQLTESQCVKDQPYTFYLDRHSPYPSKLRELGFSQDILPFRTFPSTYDDWGKKEQLSFLRGCYSANGCVIVKSRISYKTTCKEFAEKLRDTLTLDHGMFAYITTNMSRDVKFSNGTYTCRESYDVNITRYKDIQRFAMMIGFVQKYKQEALTEVLKFRALRVIGIRSGDEELVYDFSEPKTNWGIVEGFVVHNCGEFIFLNDTSCNLASINLYKFYNNETFHFDIDGYLHLITLLQLVLEATIHWGYFPTPQIAEQTYKYRATGLGFTNLGTLLMAMGVPYDSDEARSISGALASMMTAQSYIASALMAKDVGPFECYNDNRGSMRTIMFKHRDAWCSNSLSKLMHHNLLGKIIPGDFTDIEFKNPVSELWEEALRLGKSHGYRNAQVTLLAPTGTIAFAMDCDSTSSEPFFSHIIYKKLADGSWMKLVNGTIPITLKNLNYHDDAINTIMKELDKGTAIENLPPSLLKPEHHSIFDTASTNGDGKRYLSPESHVKMVAALQPHLSGGISKTINLPSEATPEDVKSIFYLAWKLGCKGITIYRDGCKSVQPLTTRKEEIKDPTDLDKMNYYELLDYTKSFHNRKADVVGRTVREQLPYEPKCIKNEIEMANQTFHVMRSFYEDGRLGEIFVTAAKQGSTVKGMLEVLSMVVSKALQYGIPAEKISKTLRNHDFSPNGFVQHHPNIKSAMSIPDLMSKFIDISHGDYKYCQVKPESSGNAVEHFIINGDHVHENVPRDSTLEVVVGDTCASCGSSKMVMAGTCKYCIVCGTSSGCS